MEDSAITKKATELIGQFGGNARYVCLEVIDQLKHLEGFWRGDAIDPVRWWQLVMTKADEILNNL